MCRIIMMNRAVMVGATLLALVTVGIGRLFPGQTTETAAGLALGFLFLQFVWYQCLVFGEPGSVEVGIGPFAFRAKLAPQPPEAAPAGPVAVPAGGTGRDVLLALGLSLGLPVVALASYLVVWETGWVFAPIPFVFTPILAIIALLRRPSGNRASRSSRSAARAGIGRGDGRMVGDGAG